MYSSIEFSLRSSWVSIRKEVSLVFFAAAIPELTAIGAERRKVGLTNMSAVLPKRFLTDEGPNIGKTK